MRLLYRQIRLSKSKREIPIAYDVDVVVVGGATGSVTFAIEAFQRRKSLSCGHAYLGEDITATLRLWLEDGETSSPPIPPVRA